MCEISTDKETQWLLLGNGAHTFSSSQLSLEGTCAEFPLCPIIM